MKLTGLVETQLVDRFGVPFGEPNVELMHTYVANFINMLYGQMAQVSQWTPVGARLQNTGSTVTTLTRTANFLRIDAAVGDANKGLVVGTGTGATTISSYSLGTKIVHGTGAGQLNYQAVVYEAPEVGATETKVKIKRVFDNASSDGSRTINEIGLYTAEPALGPQQIFMIIRDVLSTPFVIPLGASGQITYHLRVVYG